MIRLLLSLGAIGILAQAQIPAWRATLRGVGPIRVGMTVEQVRAAVGGTSPAIVDSAVECDYPEIPGVPAGIDLMTSAGRVVRYEVDSAGIRTPSGAEVGMSEDSVLTLYRGRMHVVPDPYDGPEWHNLIYEPSPADSMYGLIFQTDGKKIVGYRAGRSPQVEYIEGCL